MDNLFNLGYGIYCNNIMFTYNNGEIVDEWLVFSVGGGEIKNHNEERNSSSNNVYKHENMRQNETK